MRLGERHGRRRLPLFLAIICAALLAVIYAEVDRDTGEGAAIAAPTAPARQGGSAAAPSFTLPPISDFADVLERPLFSPTRRPAEARPAEPAPGLPSSLILVGTVVSSEGRHALIQHGEAASLQRVAVGDRFGGWTVEAILTDRVVLSRDGSREEIKPRARAASGPAAPPQVVPNVLPGLPPEVAEALGLTPPANPTAAPARQPPPAPPRR
jgi:hypothetical protein